MPTALRIAVAAGAGAAVLLTGFVATASAEPTATRPITGGKTVIAYDAATLAAAKKAAVSFAAVTGSSSKNGRLTLKVSDGTAGESGYLINHTGGLTISHGSKKFQILDIDYDTQRERATAKVTGKGRVTAFVLGDPQRGGGSPTTLEFGGYPVTLAPSLAKAVDSALGTTVFAAHPKFGVGDTTIDVKNS